MSSGTFPNGKRFAITIVDDTDDATVESVGPMYELLASLGMRTTKTVWSLDYPGRSRGFWKSQTLEDEDYREFVLTLRQQGFEIAWHGATMETSKRRRTVAGLERFKEIFREYPRVHANHAENRENIYWGTSRIDNPALKYLYGRIVGMSPDYFSGHVAHSPYGWGEECARHVHYVRNLTFNTINLATINPSMPYHDPSRPLVRWWFSATDAEDAFEFAQLLTEANLDRLEREGGICIIATHFGKDFVKDGRVLRPIRTRLEALARRPGWFPPVGKLLDWLREQRGSDELPMAEWKRMQWRWAFDLAVRKLRRRRDREERAVFYA